VFIDLYECSLLAQFKINFVSMQDSIVADPVMEGNKTVGLRGYLGAIWHILEKKMNFT
jgi:hypothetical protein